MIKILKTVTASPEQWEIIIEGMRNPHNSWTNSDSYKTVIENPKTLNTADFEFFVGEKDHTRMMSLANGGPVHAKYRRMIPVWVTINAPLYFWKEFETYRTGVAPNPTDIELNSCSTMHKVTEKEFDLNDFSTDHLFPDTIKELQRDIDNLNYYRSMFFDYKSKKEGAIAKQYWWQIIQTLPTSYNQRRTMFTNYEALSAMYYWRHDHRLDEWRKLCEWMKTLPYSEIITVHEEIFSQEAAKEGTKSAVEDVMMPAT